MQLLAMEEGARFRSSTKEEHERCMLGAVPANTRRCTDTWVKAFQAYNSSMNLKTCSAEELFAVLEGFYFDLKKKDGTLYRRASYLTARGAIQRHLRELHRRFNIYSDQAFEQSNKF